MTEDGFDRPQWMPPQPPFVEIPHQHAIVPHPLKQPLDLNTAFPWPQAEMCGDDLHRHASARKVQVDGTTGFVHRHAEVQQPNVPSLTAREYRIPVVPLTFQKRRPSDYLQFGLFAQPVGKFKPVPVRGVNFLYSNDICIEFADDIANAVRVIPSIPADTSMNVVGGEGETHRYAGDFP